MLARAGHARHQSWLQRRRCRAAWTSPSRRARLRRRTAAALCRQQPSRATSRVAVRVTPTAVRRCAARWKGTFGTRSPSSWAVVTAHAAARCVSSASPSPPAPHGERCRHPLAKSTCLQPVLKKPSGARCSRRWSSRSAPAPRASRRSLPRHAALTCASAAASLLAGPRCDAMLRAGRAPVGHRGVRAGGDCVERHGVRSLAAPARAGRLQPPLGFGCAVRRCSLRAAAPHLALRARRESAPGATLRVRSRGERATEVRPALGLAVRSPH